MYPPEQDFIVERTDDIYSLFKRQNNMFRKKGNPSSQTLVFV